MHACAYGCVMYATVLYGQVDEYEIVYGGETSKRSLLGGPECPTHISVAAFCVLFQEH